MVKIAIQGHPTRGKEIIQILESLGGINIIEYKGCEEDWWYYICPDDNYILYSDEEDSYEFKLYTLEEFEKEFPFKIGDKVIITGYIPYKVIALEYYNNKLCYKLDNCLHYVPEILEPYKEMEERNITLTLEKAKEWYKKGGELKEVALQAYSEEELNKIELPRTWEEFCENYPVKAGECWLGTQSSINIAESNFQRRLKNWIPSKKSAEAHLAMIQLEQLRDCWRKGWKPNWNNGMQPKYCMYYYRGKLDIGTLYESSRFLSFPTKEMAEEFLRCFRDLIEKAGDLI